MNISYDYQIFSSQRFGGISRYFYELANNLAGLDDETVECLINSPVFINEYLHYSRMSLQINGLFLPAFPRSNRIYGFINKLMSPLAYSHFRPDIVHETYYSPGTVVPHGSRIVITVYDMIHELYPEYFSVNDRTREYKKIAVQRADHVICISDNTRNDLIRFLGVPLEKTTVVHLGFTLTKSDNCNMPQLNRPFILYVGSRRGYKNFQSLLTAYASRSELLNHYDLVVFGGGSLKLYEVELIKSLQIPLQKVVQISGGDGILNGLYKQASMFVYPSLYEGFGIPPLEAMSFSCPVACSNTSSIPEVVGDAAIQFDPFDTDSIADALVNLSSNLDLQRTMIAQGLERIKIFSWKQCAMQTFDVYRNLL